MKNFSFVLCLFVVKFGILGMIAVPNNIAWGAAIVASLFVTFAFFGGKK